MLKCNLKKHQSGLGLIEALISLIVISVGLLGIAALQLSSLKQSSSAQFHSQAVWFSYEISDRILANNTSFNAYNSIDTNGSYSMDCTSSECTSAQMVTADAADWKAMVERLPSGRGVISSPAANTLTISVMWNDGAETSNCINGEPDSSEMTCYTITMVTNPPAGP